MQKIIVFTDTHMQLEVGQGKLDPDVQLQKGIAHVNEFNSDAERVIFCGDLTHKGDTASYEKLKKRLEDLKLPYHLLLGNHDNRENFMSVFPDQIIDENGFVQQVINTPHADLILLDTLNGPPYDYPYSHQGLLCEKRLAWLDAQLQKSGTNSSIIFMHHPAHNTGFAGMDVIKLMDGNAFYDVVKHHNTTRHIICGHVHRTISGSYQGIPFSIFKSTVGQMPMMFDSLYTNLEVNEPSAYGIVCVSDDSILVHTEDFELSDLRSMIK